MPFYTKRRSWRGLVCDPCYDFGCLSTCFRRIILWPDGFRACYLSAQAAALTCRRDPITELRDDFSVVRLDGHAPLRLSLSYFGTCSGAYGAAGNAVLRSHVRLLSLGFGSGPTATRGRRAVCWFSCCWRGPMVCLKRHG